MLDVLARITRGDKRPVYASVTVPTGTVTIQASPAPSATVLNLAVRTSVTAGAASATQTVQSTKGMVAGQTLYFSTGGGVARVIGSIVDATTVILTATITTVTGDLVTAAAHASLVDAAATGYDTGAAATVRVWYSLDTTTPADLLAGDYEVVFKFTGIPTDTIPRNYRVSVGVLVDDQ